jgi:hypothetical protein
MRHFFYLEADPRYSVSSGSQLTSVIRTALPQQQQRAQSSDRECQEVGQKINYQKEWLAVEVKTEGKD